MGTKLPSKTYHDAALFKPEPPDNNIHIKRLFCGREAALEQGVNRLRSNFDVAGRRSRRHDKQPWVLHGQSRSGKSHLARRILAAFPASQRRIQILIQANERLNALSVMKAIFETMRGEYGNRIYDQRHDVDPAAQPQLVLVDNLIGHIGLFEPGIQSVSLSLEKGGKQAAEAGVELGGAPLLVKFMGKFQSEASEKQTVQLALREPTPIDLAQVCGIMVEALLRFTTTNHVLILVDDVDLLEAYSGPQQNGRVERSILADALHELHGAPGVDVILTARSWYAHTRKQLDELVNLSDYPELTGADLAAIHDRHLAAFAGKARLKRFLSRSALEQLAAEVEYLPGVFLQFLRTVFPAYVQVPDREERDFDWLLGVLRARYLMVRKQCLPVCLVLEENVKAGILTLNVSDGKVMVQGTVVVNLFIYQSYFNEALYFIPPIVRKLLPPDTEPERGGGT